MTTRNTLLALVIACSLIFISSAPATVAVGDEINDQYIWTDHSEYHIGEEVTITVKNDGSARSTPIRYNFGMRIRHLESDEVVYGPIVGVGLPAVPDHGKEETFYWDQRCELGKQVSPGIYRVEAERYFEHTVEFEIVSPYVAPEDPPIENDNK